MLLRDLLRKKLAGWKDDLPATWRKIFGETELNFESRAFMCQCRAHDIVIPGRRGEVIPGRGDQAVSCALILARLPLGGKGG